MKNLYSLTRALLSIAVAILGSIAASALHLSGYQGAALGLQAVAIASSGLAMLWIVKTSRLTRQAQDVCRRIAAGDFEARILSIPEHDSLTGLLRVINDMIDGCDAFVREATAAMDAVHHNKYYRRILPGGLHGALLQGANTINDATASIETRIRQFERQTSELEGSVGSIVSALDNGATEMSGTAANLRVGASSTRERINSIGSASEQAATSMQSVASATAMLASNANGVGADIMRSAEIAERAVERVGDAAGSVDVLKEVASRISEVVKSINAIASQTNLLALNATIEAARAGERAAVSPSSPTRSRRWRPRPRTLPPNRGAGRAGPVGRRPRRSLDHRNRHRDHGSKRYHRQGRRTSKAQAQATAEIARSIDSAFAVVGEIAADIQALAQTAKDTEQLATSTMAHRATCRRSPAC